MHQQTQSSLDTVTALCRLGLKTAFSALPAHALPAGDGHDPSELEYSPTARSGAQLLPAAPPEAVPAAVAQAPPGREFGTRPKVGSGCAACCRCHHVGLFQRGGHEEGGAAAAPGGQRDSRQGFSGCCGPEAVLPAERTA